MNMFCQAMLERASLCEAFTLIWMFRVPGGQMWLHGGAEVQLWVSTRKPSETHHHVQVIPLQCSRGYTE